MIWCVCFFFSLSYTFSFFFISSPDAAVYHGFEHFYEPYAARVSCQRAFPNWKCTFFMHYKNIYIVHIHKCITRVDSSNATNCCSILDDDAIFKVTIAIAIAFSVLLFLLRVIHSSIYIPKRKYLFKLKLSDTHSCFHPK